VVEHPSVAFFSMFPQVIPASTTSTAVRFPSLFNTVHFYLSLGLPHVSFIFEGAPPIFRQIFLLLLCGTRLSDRFPVLFPSRYSASPCSPSPSSLRKILRRLPLLKLRTVSRHSSRVLAPCILPTLSNRLLTQYSLFSGATSPLSFRFEPPHGKML